LAVNRYRTDVPDVYETVRTYLPTQGTVPIKQIILARGHDSTRFKEFYDFDAVDLGLVDYIEPKYLDMSPRDRGLIRFDEERNKRRCRGGDKNTGKWEDFKESGTVFYHPGFNECFETYEVNNLPQRPVTGVNEVILAKSHTERPIFAEFTRSDLIKMDLRQWTGKKYITDHILEFTLDRI